MLNNFNQVIIIGTGPAALMAGTVLLDRGFEVVFYEQKKAAARKFLVAGNGGFNLSNNIDKKLFLAMYNSPEIQKMVTHFDAKDLIGFLDKIEIPTYVGSSGKLFPEKHIKPIHVLNNWLKYLRNKGAIFNFETTFLDFDHSKITLENKEGIFELDFHKLILALGGGSWSITGSNDKWLSMLKLKNIPVKDFEASNAGFNIQFDCNSFEGKAIKHLNCKLGNQQKYGEIVITKYGFEGAPIYYLNSAFRAGNTTLFIDAKPSFEVDKIINLLMQSKNITEGLKQLKLDKFFINYIKSKLNKDSFLNPIYLANFIKAIPFEVNSLRPVEEAISTVGGVLFEALNENLSFKKYENVYCCGEMIDWDAPTGGYLLQACFASGVWLGKHLL